MERRDEEDEMSYCGGMDFWFAVTNKESRKEIVLNTKDVRSFYEIPDGTELDMRHGETITVFETIDQIKALWGDE
jgi:hypothetical protein